MFWRAHAVLYMNVYPQYYVHIQLIYVCRICVHIHFIRHVLVGDRHGESTTPQQRRQRRALSSQNNKFPRSDSKKGARRFRPHSRTKMRVFLKLKPFSYALRWRRQERRCIKHIGETIPRDVLN